MTREEIYSQCVHEISKTNCILLEAATGVGKTAVSIRLANHLVNSQWYKDSKTINILILVAKRVHKQTWEDELEKWGQIHHPTAQIVIKKECYESLHHHTREHWDIILADEVHHIGSETRLELMKDISFGYFIGLSATIPNKLKQLFKYRYHAGIVSCNLTEAIGSDILPEPTILLFPLMLDNRQPTETWEINTKAPGPVHRGEYRELWNFKRQKLHAILSCTQKQKLIEFDKLIEWEKNKYMQTRSEGVKQSWLFHAGKRLEYLAEIKVPIIQDILRHLDKHRTITFCKTIEQAEAAGKWCIHSKNQSAQYIYEMFNTKRIDHITAVNILNENANLVDCKYAIFCNLSSSDLVSFQRLGRSLRHKHPVIILPYYQGTREEEIVKDMTEGFNKDFIKTIHSIQEI